MYTESTDPDRTFSLEVICEDDEPKVELTYLLASPADDFGLDPDRFTPDGDVQTQLDGNGADGGSWSFSTASETFIHEKPDTLLTDLGQAKTMQLEVRDTHGANVGEYTFNLEGVSSALESLSCYQIRSEDGE